MSSVSITATGERQASPSLMVALNPSASMVRAVLNIMKDAPESAASPSAAIRWWYIRRIGSTYSPPASTSIRCLNMAHAITPMEAMTNAPDISWEVERGAFARGSEKPG